MKKDKVILCAVSIIIVVALLIFGKYNDSLINMEETSSEKDTTGNKKIKTEKELLEENEHGLNEDVEVNGLLWNIEEVEVISEFEQLDEYYKENGNFMYDKERLPLWSQFFDEEGRYILIRYRVENVSSESKTIMPGNLVFYDRYENDSFHSVDFYEMDGRCTSIDTGEYENFKGATVELPAQSSMEFEYVGYWNCYESPIYNLYVALSSASKNIHTNGMAGEPKVKLGIEPKAMSLWEEGAEADDTYAEMRNIPEMKIRQWTNLEMRTYQEKGFPTVESDKPLEKVVEQDYEFIEDISTKIKGARVLSWDEMPQDYVERGYLEQMAKRYHEVYDISPDDLKLLVLDISYTARELESEIVQMNKFNCEFYNRSYLYTRTDEGKRWVFGTMDDWMVKSNDTNPWRTKHINVEMMKDGDTVELEAVYILPPDIYDNETALYFYGGYLIDFYGEEDGEPQPIAEIKLD